MSEEKTAVEYLREELKGKLVSSPDDPPRFVPTGTEDATGGVRFWMKPSEFGAYVRYSDLIKKLKEARHPKLSAHAWSGDMDEQENWKVRIEHDLFDVDGEYVVCIEVEYQEGLGKDPIESLATPTPEQAREMADALLVYAGMAETQNARLKEQRQLSDNGTIERS